MLFKGAQSGIISSGNTWERRSQSYFGSGNDVPVGTTFPWNAIKPG